MEEIWKDVVGYEGLYKVSNLGNVINKHGYIRKSYLHKLGYVHITLCKNCYHLTYKIHRIVASAFIPNPNSLPCINHKNGIKTENYVENLEWITYADNSKHALENGLLGGFMKGGKNILRILTEDNVRTIKELLNNGLSQYRIANLFNVNRGTIKAIKEKRTWKNI